MSKTRHKNRIAKSVPTPLYHQTSPENARKILAEQCMLPGTAGLAGGGIYFTLSPEQTHHKAQSSGIILQCDVKLGKIKTCDGSWTDGSLRRLIKEGYDSVQLQRSAIRGYGGTEYVIYDPSQIVGISVYEEIVPLVKKVVPQVLVKCKQNNKGAGCLGPDGRWHEYRDFTIKHTQPMINAYGLPYVARDDIRDDILRMKYNWW